MVGAFGGILARRVLAGALLVLVGVLLVDYPVFRPLLAALALAYVVVLWRRPLVWLAVLPAAVPWLELAHWSGRLFVEDIDILFLLTLALLLARQVAVGANKMRRPAMVHAAAFALAASYAVSLALSPWPDWSAPDLVASFLSPANSLRLGKSLFWAAALSPFVLRDFQRSPEEARRMVVVGMVVGAFGMGLMALWERGVLEALLRGTNLYGIVGPLLDFTTAYRVTGTFAEMHTGGEAIDGFLALTWPMMVAALAMSRRPWALAACSLALLLVLYAVIVTFSRGLLFSLPVAGAVLLVGLIRASNSGRGAAARRRVLLPAAMLAALAALAAYGHGKGGILSDVAMLMLFLGVCGLAWRPPSLSVRGVALGLLFALGSWGVARGMYTSKWQPMPVDEAWLLALPLVVGSMLLGHLAGRQLPRGGEVRPLLTLSLIAIVGIGILVPALLGFRMAGRLADAGTDLSTRTEHWRHAWSLKSGHWTDRLFGMGLGSFPREYHWDNANRPEGSGNFTLLREDANTFVRTAGGKDLRLGQRIDSPSTPWVQLDLRARSEAAEALLKIRVCRRFVIHPTEWNGQCATVNHRLPSTHGDWVPLSFELDVAGLGSGFGFGRPPLMLEINNRREYALMFVPPAVVDIDDVELRDGTGRSLLANGNFEQGMDHWLPYYDFNHLPWHIKNLWLHMYFEQGVLGVLAFSLAWLVALGLGWQGAKRGDAFAVGAAAALSAFVAVGTFGSPIDAPRVAWLYYFLFFTVAGTSVGRAAVGKGPAIRVDRPPS